MTDADKKETNPATELSPISQAQAILEELNNQKSSVLSNSQAVLLQVEELRNQQSSLAEQITTLEAQRTTIQNILNGLNAIKDETIASKNTVMSDLQIITQKIEEFSLLKNQLDVSAAEITNEQRVWSGKLTELDSSLNQIRADIQNLKQTIDMELPNFRQRVESEQSTLRQNIEREQATFRQTIETEQSSLRQKLEELSTSFQTKHTELQSKQTQEFTDKIKELQTRTNDRIGEEIKAAEIIMAVLEKYEDQAHQVLGTVVRTSQAGVYKLDAIEEGKAKKFFRAWASTFMVFAVAILVGPSLIEIFLKGAPNANINWHDWLARLPVSAVLFIPAFYFARESTRHSNSERRSKRIEQILSTIDPYLELLDEKLRDPLKIKLADQIFNPNETAPQTSDDEVKGFISNFITAIKVALKKD